MKKRMYILILCFLLIFSLSFTACVKETTTPPKTNPDTIEFSEPPIEPVDLSSWVGGYYFGAGTFSKNTVAYWIVIYEENGSYYAHMYGSGWMYGLGATAKVVGDPASVELILEEYVWEHYEDNEVGDILIQFSLLEDGTLWTTWVDLVPVVNFNAGEDIVKDGVCFVKASKENPVPNPGMDDIGWNNDWSLQ